MVVYLLLLIVVVCVWGCMRVGVVEVDLLLLIVVCAGVVVCVRVWVCGAGFVVVDCGVLWGWMWLRVSGGSRDRSGCGGDMFCRMWW